MLRRKKVLREEVMPEFDAGIEATPEDSKIFVDKSLEIAEYIFRLMEEKGMKQRDLAAKMGKSEAEVSKLLGGMHNYTLRSIAKLEAALGATIISTPLSKKWSFPKAQGEAKRFQLVVPIDSPKSRPTLQFARIITMAPNDSSFSSQAI
jgi:transcriptional regulator with XRE-family HTH domain